MASPSPRVLSNRVDVYRATEGRSGAGVIYTYPDTPDFEAVACSVQAKTRKLADDDLARVTSQQEYDVIFGVNLGLRIRDKLVWTDSIGIKRDLLVMTSYDDAGKGDVFVARCREVE